MSFSPSHHTPDRVTPVSHVASKMSFTLLCPDITVYLLYVPKSLLLLSLFHLFRLSISNRYGLPVGLLPAGVHLYYITGAQFFSIRITWPCHLHWTLSIKRNIGSTFNSSLVSLFRSLSLRVSPLMSLSTLISAACTLHVFQTC